MKIRYAVGVGASVVVLNCGTYVEVTALNPPPRPLVSRSAASVEVYSSLPPARRHVDVALLKVDQSNGLTEADTAAMIQKLREKAAQQGCDAVFISGTSERSPLPSSGPIPPLDFGSHQLTATCVVYLSDAAVLTVAPPAAEAARAPVVADAAPKAAPSTAIQVFR